MDKPRGGQPKVDDCSCIRGTCFNGVELCSFKWMYNYRDYSPSIYPEIPKLLKPVEGKLNFPPVIKRLETHRMLRLPLFGSEIDFDQYGGV